MNDKVLVDIQNIYPDKNQPRKLFDTRKLKTLSDSVKKYGIMSPLVLEKIGDKYLIVDGERRYRVAKDLGLKEIPSVVIAPQNEVDRLIQQFHIQEQREGWTATEKAMSVYKLAKELGIGTSQAGEMLGVDKTALARYIAFGNILEKKEFEKKNINIVWTTGISGVKSVTKKIYEDKLDKAFNQQLERGLEKAIINQIYEGEIKVPFELGRLKDSFRKDPKSIEKFINTKTTVSELFIETKARGAYYLRNLINNANYVDTHAKKYLEKPDTVPSHQNILILKRAKESLENVLKRIE